MHHTQIGRNGTYVFAEYNRIAASAARCIITIATSAATDLFDFFRNYFVLRSTSAFIGSFDGGLLLLPEFFGGCSYFSSRLRSSRFSLSSLSIFRLSEHISACWESIVPRNTFSSDNSPAKVEYMSLTCCFTDTKIAILSDIHKQNHYYFDDTQRIILKLLLTDLIVFDSLNSYPSERAVNLSDSRGRSGLRCGCPLRRVSCAGAICLCRLCVRLCRLNRRPRHGGVFPCASRRC